MLRNKKHARKSVYHLCTYLLFVGLAIQTTGCGPARQDRFNADGTPFVFDIISVSPFHNSSYNSGKTTLILTFNSELDLSTINKNNISIIRDIEPTQSSAASTKDVSDSFIWPPQTSADGRTLIYSLPNNETLPNAKYTVVLKSGIQDTYGDFIANQEFINIKLYFWVGAAYNGGVDNDPDFPPHVVSVIYRKIDQYSCGGIMLVATFNESLSEPPVMYFKYKNVYLGKNKDDEYKKWENAKTLQPHSIGTTDLLTQRSWHAYLPQGMGGCTPGRAFRLVIDSAKDRDGTTMDDEVTLNWVGQDGVVLINGAGQPFTETVNGHRLSEGPLISGFGGRLGVDGHAINANGDNFTESETFGPYLGL
ncbi:MAG: Ig-like domain-containing protein [Bdellovibrionales bacterium]|nr:Ig-like domain-containing protein [Bdellovibrionales bacterium]